MTKNVMIVAGEASGDMYGAKLVEEAHRLDSSVRFFGIGGAKMQKAGVDILVDSKEMAVMGLFEVLAHFPTIYSAFKKLKKSLLEDKPDLLILIDYPGFNIRFAHVAKKAGVKVLYYITPQVWAWHASRARKIARLVDHAAVLFPFEVPFFEKEGLAVTFVGHPLLDMAVASMPKSEAQLQFGLDPSRKTLGLFPGSRKREISALLPLMLDSALLLQKRFPELQFILPLAPSVERSIIDGYLSGYPLDIKVIEGKNYDVMQVCDCIIAASGTVTMEIALFGVPMVIVYKVAPVTYAIGSRLVKVDHAGICNIVAGERVVPELLQHDAEPVKVVAEIVRMLEDREYSESISEKLHRVRTLLGDSGASKRVAQLVIKLIREE